MSLRARFRAARLGAVLLLLALVTGACGTARAEYIAQLAADGGDISGGGTGLDGGSASGEPGASEAPVVAAPDPAQFGVQLDTFFGAGAAGMYDAAVTGVYEGLAVEAGFLPGTPDEDPLGAPLVEDGPQLLVASVPAVLVAREQLGADYVLVAMLYQRSGSVLIAPKGTPVSSLAKLEGSTIGMLGIGNRSLDLRAALAKAGLEDGTGYNSAGEYDFIFDPASSPLADMLHGGMLAAAGGTTYDEYAQLLEFGSSDGAPAYAPGQLAVRNLDETGDAMLGTGIFARASWLTDPKHKDALVRFLQGTFQGYVDCRDRPADCAQLVVDQGAPLPVGHQLWAVNEVNALVWPAPGGIGSLDMAAYQSTVDRLVATGLLAAAPPPEAVDLSYADAARKALAELDLTGSGFTPQAVPITPGGLGAEPAPTDATEDGG